MKSLPEILADVYIAAYKASMDRHGPNVDALLRMGHSNPFIGNAVTPELSRESARKTVQDFLDILRGIPEVDLHKIPSNLEDNPDAGTF